MRRNFSQALLPLWLLVAVVLPLALLGAMTWFLPRPQSGLSASVHPIGYPVETSSESDAVAAQATMRWSGARQLYAPSWSGIVLSVSAKAGQTLTTGSPVAVIDGVTRLAVASAIPFYRTLAMGSEGPDVAMLRLALFDLGLGSYGSSETFDTSLRAGIRLLCSIIGCPPNSAVFDPSWFVFLPSAQFKVQSVQLAVDQPAPQPGQVIAASTQALTGFTVGQQAGTTAASGTFPDSGQGYEFRYGDVTIPLTRAFRPADKSSVRKLAAAVSPGTSSIEGTVQLIHPKIVSEVPATALVTGASGGACVYPFGSAQPLRVRITGGEPGLTFVLPLGGVQQVLVNPYALTGLKPCP
jgi:hypothetical protein